ncbi:hypothetical protein CROQUDRAFT_673028 [Cronartium quercuum f. sp. fusiforme G11]|uniref:MADS-box domain-containing protein n=1 Tax=Cronartium quercuum f. sp. fusiforme G11 TaxID=708437 RepID=A0A9P6T997_9BASI|nr:hypothetical protein CROQUDRAFT_673028 [Cronartium quercuum f. sp. fusiforme G11]
MNQKESPGHSASSSATSSKNGGPKNVTNHSFDFRQDELSLGSRKRSRDLEEAEDDEDDEEEVSGRKKNPGRRKIDIEYIHDKGKRHITFSKRKAGIMKKAYELATLTGTQLLLLVVSDSGVVYTFTTPKLETIVSEQPGKDIILACLADGSSELQIQRESPAEATPTIPTRTLPNPDFVENGSVQQEKTQNPDGLASLEDPYSLNPCQTGPSVSFDTLAPGAFFPESTHAMLATYDPLMMGPQGVDSLYSPFGNQLDGDASNQFSTIPHNLPPRAPGSASYLDMGFNQPFMTTNQASSINNPTDDQRIKRRKTEADLRSRSRSHDLGLPHNPSFLQTPFPVELQNPWGESQNSMRYNTAQQARILALHQPTLANAVTSFIMNEYLSLEISLPFEGGSRAELNRLERTMKLFLDACDQFPIMFTTPNVGKSWKDQIVPSREMLGKCIGFFLNEFLPRMASGDTIDVMVCYQDMQKLADYINFLYEQPADSTTDLAELNISVAGADEVQASSTLAEPFSGAGMVPSTSPLGKSKTAPKLKPRKGGNVNLRGGRLSTNLEEYTAWCRQNKLSWPGNNPHSAIKAWFQVERVRRTFCCCSPVENAANGTFEKMYKIRFPASTIKLIRKHDKLQLEVKKSDDGSEWNAFRYFDSELYAGDESDEDEAFCTSGDKPFEPAMLNRVCKERGLSEDNAIGFLESRRLMRQQIEAGDYEDDGFESKVPPKGGKQAFRVKRPMSKSKGNSSHEGIKSDTTDIQVTQTNSSLRSSH